jgi:hypothetical protein
MPDGQPAKAAPSFRVRYDSLEKRREELAARLAALSERVSHPAQRRARTLLTATFRKSSLVQRAAVLEAANWLITMIDRATSVM